MEFGSPVATDYSQSNLNMNGNPNGKRKRSPSTTTINGGGIANLNGNHLEIPQDSNLYSSDLSDLPSSSNGCPSISQSQSQEPVQEDMQVDYHEEEEEEAEEFQSKPSKAKKQRPKTIFGGNKKKKGKGKLKKEREAAFALQQEEEERQRGEGGGKKGNGFEKLSRPLLELETIGNGDDDEEDEGEGGRERKLWLKVEDRKKLVVVISGLDPALLEESLPSLTHLDEDESTEQPIGISLGKALESEVGEGGVDMKELVLRLKFLIQPLLQSSSLTYIEDDSEDESPERTSKTPAGPTFKLRDSETLTQERDRLSNLNLICGLLEDLATQYGAGDVDLLRDLNEDGSKKSEEGKTEEWKKAKSIGAKEEMEEMAIMLGLKEPKKEKVKRGDEERVRKFSLHMRMANGDYFTNAAEISEDVLEEMDTGNADLIEIFPTTSTFSTSHSSNPTSIPTLGSLLSLQSHSSLLPMQATSQQLLEKKHNILVPVKAASFGEFSSFLPSYDSRGSSMSFGASEVVSRYKTDERRLRYGDEWRDPEGVKAEEWRIKGEKEVTMQPPPLAPASNMTNPDPDQGSKSKKLTLEELLERPLPEGIQVEILRSSVAQLEIEEQLQKELSRNLEIVKKLQEYQWERLRREYSRNRKEDLKIREELKSLPKNKNGRVGEKEVVKAMKRKDRSKVAIKIGDEERCLAKELLESLSRLVGLKERNYGNSRMVDINGLRALASSSAIPDSDNVPQGFWGTLDVPETSTPSSVPSIVDNLTFRLTSICEETKRKEAEESGSAFGIITKEKNVGLLEKIGDSRNYDGMDDKHNIPESIAPIPTPPVQRQVVPPPQQQPHYQTQQFNQQVPRVHRPQVNHQTQVRPINTNSNYSTNMQHQPPGQRTTTPINPAFRVNSGGQSMNQVNSFRPAGSPPYGSPNPNVRPQAAWNQNPNGINQNINPQMRVPNGFQNGYRPPQPQAQMQGYHPQPQQEQPHQQMNLRQQQSPGTQFGPPQMQQGQFQPYTPQNVNSRQQ